MSKDPIRAGEIVVFNVDVSSAYQHLLFYLFSARVTLAFEKINIHNKQYFFVFSAFAMSLVGVIYVPIVTAWHLFTFLFRLQQQD